MDIWRRVEHKRNDWELVIVGDGPEKAYMEETAKRFNLRNVKFEGYQTNTAEYYQAASIFLLTSKYEGWSMSLIEAMSSECTPVLFGSYAAAYDIVKDGETGFIIPPFDKKMFADTLLQLMENKEKRIEVGRKAKESMTRYDMDEIGKQWLTLLTE